MKAKIFKLSLLLLHLTVKGYSQISLAKGFECKFSKEHYSEDYFSNGTYNFKTDAWGQVVEAPAEMKSAVEESLRNKIVFKKTKDNLFWGTGHLDGQFVYVIIVPESLTTVRVISPVNNTQFANHSAWLLQQVRNNRLSGKDFYFTNYRGRSCRE